MATKPKLALIPSGYGANKVYSVLPSNGDGDFDFNRVGIATRINKDGLIESVDSNVPRLNYPLIDGVVSGCPSLLLEPSRTNILPYSEDFSNASWIKNNCTITSDNSVSPDGTQNADKLDFTTSNGEIVKTTSFVSGQEYTMSFYAKTESGTLDFTYGNMDYSIISGTATTEWQRFEITQTLPITTRYPKIQTTEIGSLLLWGFQIEQGSYATSYIPTNGEANGVTRLAETCNGAGNSDTFSDSEGVLMAEIKSIANTGASGSVYLGDGGNSNRLQIVLHSDGLIRGFSTGANGGITSVLESNVKNYDSFHKISLIYNSTNLELWIDGFKLDSENGNFSYNNAELSTLQFFIGSEIIYGNTKQIQYFDTTLTDSELEQLTSWVSFQEMAEAQLYSIE